MTDGNGQVARRASVRPFGQGTASALDQPLRFLDHPLEAEIGSEGGLYHLDVRLLPVTGPIPPTADPVPLIGVVLEDPQRFNRYAYGLNNPLRYLDPTGLAPSGPKGTKPPAKPRLPPIDPVTGRPATEPLPEPKVIDLDPSEETTERIPWRGTITEEETKIAPGANGPDDAVARRGAIKEGEFDDAADTKPDAKRLISEQNNRLACAYGMDSCRPDPLRMGSDIHTVARLGRSASRSTCSGAATGPCGQATDFDTAGASHTLKQDERARRN